MALHTYCFSTWKLPPNKWSSCVRCDTCTAFAEALTHDLFTHLQQLSVVGTERLVRRSGPWISQLHQVSCCPFTLTQIVFCCRPSCLPSLMMPLRTSRTPLDPLMMATSPMQWALCQETLSAVLAQSLRMMMVHLLFSSSASSVENAHASCACIAKSSKPQAFVL